MFYQFFCYLLHIRQVFTTNFFLSFFLPFIVCYQITLAFRGICWHKMFPRINAHIQNNTFTQIIWRATVAAAAYTQMSHFSYTNIKRDVWRFTKWNLYVLFWHFCAPFSSMIYIFFIRIVSFYIYFCLNDAYDDRVDVQHLIWMAFFYVYMAEYSNIIFGTWMRIMGSVVKRFITLFSFVVGVLSLKIVVVSIRQLNLCNQFFRERWSPSSWSLLAMLIRLFVCCYCFAFCTFHHWCWFDCVCGFDTTFPDSFICNPLCGVSFLYLPIRRYRKNIFWCGSHTGINSFSFLRACVWQSTIFGCFIRRQWKDIFQVD